MAERPRRAPRQRRSRETVDTLLEAAAQMFTRRGLAATTNHIAERAGLSIGTLYQYFPNKEALLHALAARHLAEAQARLMPLLAELRRGAPESEETVRQVLEAVVDLRRCGRGGEDPVYRGAGTDRVISRKSQSHRLWMTQQPQPGCSVNCSGEPPLYGTIRG